MAGECEKFRYASGETVAVDDRVRYAGEPGTVVSVVPPACGRPEPGVGVLVRLDSGGQVHFSGASLHPALERL